MSNGTSTSNNGQEAVREQSGEFFGKYRGLVISNVDPMQRGRLQVQVPEVAELIPISWAEACFPAGGPQFGSFAVPSVGASVWIEFEQGDPNRPIWTGVFYKNAAEVPALARSVPPGVPGISHVTPLQNALSVSDAPGPAGGILLKGGLASITINDTGITIQNGKGASVALIGSQVIVNSGALVVT
jgi:uncharacterized protein involved in type VI secretion and phage assembly